MILIRYTPAYMTYRVSLSPFKHDLEASGYFVEGLILPESGDLPVIGWT